MRFLTDQCLFETTVTFLKDLGHDVLRVTDIGLAAAQDEEIAAKAVELGRVVVTNDSDFGNILHFPPGQPPGVIVLKASKRNQEAVHHQLRECFERIPAKKIGASLVVVDHNKYRVRD